MAKPIVVVAGALANKPRNAGEAWVRLSWVRGLLRLGCQVAFVEQIDATACVDAEGRPAPFDGSLNRSWFEEVINGAGLRHASALVCGAEAAFGLDRDEVHDLLSDADLLVNISGNLVDEKLRAAVRASAYVDLDPGFTQFWAEDDARAMRLEGHDHYFTVGSNVGAPGCPIPNVGHRWIPMWPPVVLEDWPRADTGPGDAPRFTTIATWRGSFGPVERDRRRLGLKVHEFRKYMALPDAVPDVCFELALLIHPDEVADLALLAEHRWRLVDPLEQAGTLQSFAAYVAGSDAEFSVAQELYVATSSGWFSDRTTRYLASGRPALVQDTGFSAHLPTGLGLVSFHDHDSAVAGARSILRDYRAHAAAARELAGEHFDSDRVLSAFLERCLR